MADNNQQCQQWDLWLVGLPAMKSTWNVRDFWLACPVVPAQAAVLEPATKSIHNSRYMWFCQRGLQCWNLLQNQFTSLLGMSGGHPRSLQWNLHSQFPIFVKSLHNFYELTSQKLARVSKIMVIFISKKGTRNDPLDTVNEVTSSS
jgi:hypothetical protein